MEGGASYVMSMPRARGIAYAILYGSKMTNEEVMAYVEGASTESVLVILTGKT